MGQPPSSNSSWTPGGPPSSSCSASSCSASSAVSSPLALPGNLANVQQSQRRGKEMTDTTSAVAARIQQEVLAQGPGSVDLLSGPAAVTLTDVAIDFGPVHAVRRVTFPLAANRVTAL